MKVKATDTQHQNILSGFLNHKPFMVAIGIVLAFLQTMKLIHNAQITGETAILSRLFSTSFIASLTFTCFVMPIAFFGILTAIVNRHHRTAMTVITDVGAMGLVLIFGLMMCLFSVADLFFSDFKTNKDRVYLDNHVYSLMGQRGWDDLGYRTFVLYWCDQWGISCSELYETEWGYYTGDPAELTYDSSPQQISIIINGTNIYDVSLES